MTLPLPSISKLHPGRGHIVLSSHGSNAVFSELSSTYPLKLLSSQISEDVAVVYILSYGGGLVGGDHIDLSIDVNSGAVLVLLSQGSTKVFKSRTGRRLASFQKLGPNSIDGPLSEISSLSTAQKMTATIAAQSALFLLPDPVTCFQSALYNQIQTFHLYGDASAIVLDWVTSGRKSLGEEWVFSRYYSANEIWVDGRRIAKDVTLLDDQEVVMKLPRRTLGDRLAPYSCYATVLLYGPLVRDTIAQLTIHYDRISMYKSRSPQDLVWSLSFMKSGGAVIRVAANETEEVRRWLGNQLKGVEEVVGTDVYRTAFG